MKENSHRLTFNTLIIGQRCIVFLCDTHTVYCLYHTYFRKQYIYWQNILLRIDKSDGEVKYGKKRTRLLKG